MDEFNKRKDRIKDLLKKNFNPTFIKIIDNSLMHAGHGGFDKNSKETHLFIRMISNKFKNKKKKEMHQEVYTVVREEFKNGLHALELDLGSDWL